MPIVNLLKNFIVVIPIVFGSMDEGKTPSYYQNPAPKKTELNVTEAIEIQTHLRDFIRLVLNKNPDQVNLILHKPSNIAEGGAKNTIFIAKDKEGRKLAILKVTPSNADEKNHGYGEWQALEKLSFTNLKNHKPVKLMGFGEFGIGDITYTVIAMQPASGKSLFSYMEDVTAKPKYSLPRKKALDKLKEGVILSAHVFKSLHESHPTEFISQDYYLRNDTLFNLYLDEIKHTESELTKDFDAIATEFKSSSPKGGWIHGDAHPGNIFIDLDEKTLTMIDLPDMYPSIKEPHKGGPIIEDYASFLYFLGFLGKREGLTKSEIRTLEKTFINTYKGDFDKISLSYYQTLLSMHGKRIEEKS